MDKLIEAIEFSGENPLFLTAFLSVVALSAFRRAVKTTKGLDFIYDLAKTKLSKNEFSKILNKIINSFLSLRLFSC